MALYNKGVIKIQIDNYLTPVKPDSIYCIRLPPPPPKERRVPEKRLPIYAPPKENWEEYKEGGEDHGQRGYIDNYDDTLDSTIDKPFSTEI